MTARHRFHRPIPLGVYCSPKWSIDLLLNRLPFPGGDYQERGAGAGAVIAAVNDWRSAQGAAPVRWKAFEAREDCREALQETGAEVEIGNYLARDCGKCDVVIGNPDYEIAEATIRQALADARIVAMLLPIGFLLGAKRAPLFAEHPCSVYGIPDRITFVHRMTWHANDKVSVSSSDASGSVWLVAGMGSGTWERLPTTPDEIRAAAAREAPIVLSRKGAPGLIPEANWPDAAWEVAAKIRGLGVSEMRDAA